MTTGHVIARKRHADVLRAVALLARGPSGAALPRHRRRPRAAPRLRALAQELGIADRVELAGQLERRRGARPHAPRDAVRDALDRRGVRRRLRRGDGGLAAGDRRRGRARPGGDPLRGRGPGARRARQRRRPGQRDRSPAERCEDPARRPARRRARRSSAAFSWEACGARHGRRLRGRVGPKPPPHDDAGRSSSSPTTSRPSASARSPRCTRRVPLELALFGGRSSHATAGVADPGVPHRIVGQRESYALAASGRYRAVVCGTAGRVALPAAWRGARRSRTPFVLWSALWSQPRTAAHLVAGAPLMAALYRGADAVVAYGPHVAAFARARGRTQRPSRAAGRRQRVLERAADARADRALHGGVSRTAGSGKRVGGAARCLARVRPRSISRRARPRRCGNRAPSEPRRRRGGVRRAPAARTGAQLPGRGGRLRHTVPADARLPRTLGPGRQRGHEPVHARHRQRRGRRRCRRARPPRAQRARRARRRRRRARRRAAAPARRPGAAREARRQRPPRRRRLHVRGLGVGLRTALQSLR